MKKGSRIFLILLLLSGLFWYTSSSSEEMNDSPLPFLHIHAFVDGELLLDNPGKAEEMFIRLWDQDVIPRLKNDQYSRGKQPLPMRITISPLSTASDQEAFLLSKTFGKEDCLLLATKKDGPKRIRTSCLAQFRKGIKDFQNRYRRGNDRLTRIILSASVISNCMQSCKPGNHLEIVYFSDMIEWDHGEYGYSFKEQGTNFFSARGVNAAINALQDSTTWLNGFIKKTSREMEVGKTLDHQDLKIKIIRPKHIQLEPKEGVGYTSVKRFWQEYFARFGFTTSFVIES